MKKYACKTEPEKQAPSDPTHAGRSTEFENQFKPAEVGVDHEEV
jgi:hypothetical protein